MSGTPYASLHSACGNRVARARLFTLCGEVPRVVVWEGRFYVRDQRTRCSYFEVSGQWAGDVQRVTA